MRRPMQILLRCALLFGMLGTAHADTPHGTLLTARAPVEAGAELSLAGASNGTTRWGFATLEGGLPIYQSRHGAVFAANLRIPATMIQVPDESRQTYTLRAVDLELWLLVPSESDRSFHGFGLAGGMSSFNNSTRFIEPADAGISIWGFYRGYVDRDPVDMDLSVRLGVQSENIAVADVAGVALIETPSPLTVSLGAMIGAFQGVWTTSGVRFQAGDSLEIGGGCAFPMAYIGTESPLCRPFLEIASMQP